MKLIKAYKSSAYTVLLFLFITSLLITAVKSDFFADRYAHARGYYQEPRISINKWSQGGGLIPLSITAKPAVKFQSYNYSGEAVITLYEATIDTLLKYLIHDNKFNQTIKTEDYQNLIQVAKFKQKVGGNRRNDSEILLPIEGAGIWVLNYNDGKYDINTIIVRSDIGGLVKEAKDELVFWAQSFTTKKSIGETNITLYNLLDKQSVLDRAITGTDGVGKTKLLEDADIAVLEKNNGYSIIPINLHYLNRDWNYSPFKPAEQRTRYFVFTDRPIYKPGDELYFKGIIRDDSDAEYSIPNTPFRAEIYTGWGERRTVILEKDFIPNAYGAISGEIKIPDDAPTGYYYLKLSRPDAADENTPFGWGRYWAGNNLAEFQVEYFRKPEYFLSLNTPAREFIKGDKLEFTIKGEYFSGQSLSGRTVNYKIKQSKNYWLSDYYDYYIRSSEYSYYGYWWGNIIKEDSALLNKKGVAEIEMDVSVNDGKQAYLYTIEASYRDESGNPVTAVKNVIFYSGEFSIFRNNRQYAYSLNKDYGFDIKLAPHQGGNVANINLSAEMERNHWYRNSSRKWDKETENLTVIPAVTDKNGEAALKFIAKKPGSYKLSVTGEDSRGNKINNSFYIWVPDNTGYRYSEEDDNDLSISMSSSEYEPDEAARFSIDSVIKERDVFVSVEREWLKRYQVIPIKNYNANGIVLLSDADIPNLFISVHSFGDAELDTDTANFMVSPEGKRLNVDLEPNREKYGPGDTITLTVRTTDSKGRGVSAETTIWAVDKALFELASQDNRDIFNIFWNKRGNLTDDSHSLEGIIAYNAAEGGGCFSADTEISLSDKITKPISEIKKGDYVLTRTAPAGELVKAEVIGTHEATVAGYLILNGHLKITPVHILRVNDQWQVAGNIQIGDNLINKDGFSVSVDSIEWQAGKFKVYNLKIARYHTFIANNIWVHNEKGGGGSPRSDFEDTAYWNPRVMTDSRGVARITFVLPDNLTTWVLGAVGSTKDTKVGKTLNEIKVSRDIIIRPVLPNILRIGDQIWLSSLVHNFTEEDLNFDVSFDFNAGIASNTEKSIFISAGEFEQVKWLVFPMEKNEEAEITVRAVARENNKYSDAITKKIPVRPFGYFIPKSMAGSGNASFKLDLAPNIDLSKTTIELSIAPSMLGTLPSALGYLVSYPYGCMEQTTSRLMPVIIARNNPKIFAKAIKNKNLDKMLEKGLERLKKYQRADGAWSWYYSGKSVPYVTMYITEFLAKASVANFEVGERLLNDARLYFEKNTKLDRVDNIFRTYALSLLDSEIEKKPITNTLDLPVDALAYAVLANIMNGFETEARTALNDLIAISEEDNGQRYWPGSDKIRFGSNHASTALALRALVAANGNKDIALAAAKYLINNRNGIRWANSFATAQAMLALAEFSKQNKGENPNYTYAVYLDGEIYKKGKINNLDQIEIIKIPADKINAAESSIKIEQNGSGQMYTTLLAKEFHVDKEAAGEARGLSITRRMKNLKGINYSIGVGDTVEIIFEVTGPEYTQHYAIIEDHLPAGLIPINEALKNESSRNIPRWRRWRYWQGDKDITLDGMHLSLNQIRPGTRVYSYLARVISVGNYFIPPATVSLMYAPEIYGRTDAQKLTTVESAKKIFNIPSDIAVINYPYPYGTTTIMSDSHMKAMQLPWLIQNDKTTGKLSSIHYLIIVLSLIITVIIALAVYLKLIIKNNHPD